MHLQTHVEIKSTVPLGERPIIERTRWDGKVASRFHADGVRAMPSWRDGNEWDVVLFGPKVTQAGGRHKAQSDSKFVTAADLAPSDRAAPLEAIEAKRASLKGTFDTLDQGAAALTAKLGAI